ncbi:MAG: hypothetical protein K2H75_05375, partial [Muribaculaceae bacterium]|nr:hypothetical protein [Muribaculaceae bacterium]
TGKVMAGALLTLTLGEYTADEPKDITPSGLNFDNYEDGDPFVLTASESNGGWSAPGGMLRANMDKFNKDGQLTVYLDRGAALSANTQSYVDATVQPAYAVRKLNQHVGNALVVTQPWSPAASRYSWAAAGTSGTQAQLNFYMPNGEITNKADQRHYIRVRVVYNVLHRGCHYTQKGDRKLVGGIYTSHENNWVVPGLDNALGALYGESGINFAQWVDETGKPEDIPANPEVRKPAADEIDAWDPGHKPAAEDANGYPAYIINDTRYRVYEFDTYMDNPSVASLSVQFNMLNSNTTFVIKEIKFTDLGTDEANAYLLSRRQLGWKYYNEFTSGIEDIVVDDAVEAAE